MAFIPKILKAADYTNSYSANNKVSSRLVRGSLLRSLSLRLTGQLTCTNVNNTAANTRREDEWGVVKQIDVVANGNDYLRTFSGNELWWLNKLMLGRAQTSPAIADGNANPAFDSTLFIPFFRAGSKFSQDTILDTSKLADLRLDITWGSHTDINSAATGFTVSPTIQCHQMIALTDQPNALFTMSRNIAIRQTVTGANTALQLVLPVTMLYTGYILNYASQQVAGTDLTTMQNIKLGSGGNWFYDIEPQALFQWSATGANVQSGLNDATLASGLLPDKRSSNANTRGWWFFNLAMFGSALEGLDTLNMSELTFEFNVGGAGFLSVLPLQEWPLRRQAA